MRLKLFAIILFFLSTELYSQNYNWIEPGKTYLKFYTISDGIHRIEQSDFTNAGINPTSVNPLSLKVFYKGVEIPIYVRGESNGVFEPGDYIDVFCTRNYGGTQFYYNNLVAQYTKDEYYNFYSDTNAYWISWGGANGLRYNENQIAANTPYEFNYYIKEFHAERDVVYSLGEKRSATDYRNFSNELIIGEGWYWREMQRNAFVADTFFIASLNPQVQNFNIKLFAYPNSASSSIFNEHWLIVRINGTIVDTLKRNDYDRLDETISVPASLLNSNATNIINFTYSGPTGYNGRMFFDFFRSYIPENFLFQDNAISFSTQNADSVSRVFTVSGYNPENEVNIYDVKNGIKINNFSQNGGNLVFSGKGNGRYFIENKFITRKPLKIEQRVVPNLVSTSNGADYIIVYPKIFESPAEQLRAHRESFDDYRSVKVDIKDIYDIFNYGIEDPVALRNFMAYAYNNWQAPKVGYLNLFGRGSVDPKKNLANSQYYQNLVPVWGNPVADGYFVNFTPGTFSYVQQVSAGRIPVYTVEEAQNVVNKIIAYDFQPNDKWNKMHTFITGGFNAQEQLQFANQSNSHINNYITSNPIRGEVTRVYRNDSTGQVTFNFQDSILNVINSGTLMVNYIGHAATSFWDNGIEEPAIVNNIDKLSMILSFTCFTGKFAEGNERAFGEKFLLLPNKGAISFIGSTGWSFVISGNAMNSNVFRAYSQENKRAFGDLMRRAGEFMIQDTSSFSSRNMINCYMLIGDPGQKIKLPPHPELELRSNDYALSNQYPSLGEDVRLDVTTYNFGTVADSVKIDFKLKRNGVVTKEANTVFYDLGYVDTIPFDFEMDTLGVYTVDVHIDPDNWYPEDRPENNKITIAIPLRNISYVPLKPIDNQVFPDIAISITGLNPAVNPNTSSVSVILQIDTTRLFNSSIRQTYFNNSVSGVATTFDVNIPVPDTSSVYYWRMNALVDGDSSGWSEIRRLTYNPAIESPRVGSNQLTDAGDEPVTIYKNRPGQFDQLQLNGVSFDANSGGLKLQTYDGNIFARSHGGNTFDATYFTVNNEEFFLISEEYWGYNFAKLRKIDGKILEVKNFHITGGASSDSIVNYLNTFNNSHILIAIKGFPPNSINVLTSVAKQKIMQFGSTKIDSVNNHQDKWAFISIPDGKGGYETAEAFFRYDGNWIPVSCEITTKFSTTSGSVVQTFGTADSWFNLSWQRDIVSASNLFLVNILGVKKDGSEDLIFENLSTQTSVDLSNINAFTYPNIKMVTSLGLDTISPVASPVFNRIKLSYQPPGELIPYQNSIFVSEERILYGDTVRVGVDVYNEGFKPVSGVVNKWSFVSSTGSEVVLYDTVTSPLNVGEKVSSSVLFNTENFNLPSSNPGSVNVVFETKPLGNQNQLIEFNDFAFTGFSMSPDSVSPELDVTFDGARVINGDFITVNPDVQIILLDDGMQTINPGDTLLVRIRLNGQPVPYFIGNQPNPQINFEILDNILRPQLKINFKPELLGGTNRFEFITRDKSGNIGDSLNLRLIVDSDLRIRDLLNYPNPMRDKTVFGFRLSGAEVPGSCMIHIYTVAGRLVKVIESTASIGYNEIEWDGRDNDGDLMANGVYLYRMIIEGQGEKEGSTQRLVILR